MNTAMVHFIFKNVILWQSFYRLNWANYLSHNLLGGFVYPLKLCGGFRGVNLITICPKWNLTGSHDGILKIINTKVVHVILNKISISSTIHLNTNISHNILERAPKTKSLVLQNSWIN